MDPRIGEGHRRVPQVWELIKGLFVEALQLKPEERAAFLNRSCPDGTEIRNEVEQLLNAHREAEQYLESAAELPKFALLPTVADRAFAKKDRILGTDPASQVPAGEPQRYVLGEEYARGGLGRILEARDARLNRAVAVKELLDGGKDAELRFVREALITARLQHPSIVPVHDLGTSPEGKPFYAMKMISGRPLGEVIQEKKTLHDRLGLLPNIIAVADAVAYAHQQGVIHRDLKPANVLVGAFGETVVIDWGLAADIRGSTNEAGSMGTVAGVELAHLTLAGTIKRTPQYMPPEQAQGQPADERADVYAIGALLYHVVAGGPPFEGSSSKEVIEKVIKGDLAPLETRQPHTPKDLITIVRKAMAHLPEQRYPTAKEIAEDLKRFQAGQLVSAHAYSRAALMGRWIRKHRGPVTVALLFSLLLAVVGGLSLRRILREKAVAQQERNAAQQRKNETILIRATNALRADPTSTVAWLKHYPWDAINWRAARDLSIAAVQVGIAKQVLSSSWPALSPDGRLLATGGVAPSIIRDLTSDRILKEHPRPARIWFSPDSKRALLNDVGSSTMELVSFESNEVRRFIGHVGEIYGADFSSDGQWVMSAGADNTVRLWSTSSDQKRILGLECVFRWGSVSPTRTSFAVGCEDGAIKLFDFNGKSSVAYRGVGGATTPGAFSLDGRYLAVGGEDGSIALVDLSQNRSQVLQGNSSVRSLSFSSDFKLLASADHEGRVRIWDLDTRVFKILHSHANVTKVTFSPNDRILATTDAEDSSITLWEAATGESVQTFKGHQGIVTHISFSPDGRKLITSSGSEAVTRIWEVTAKTGQVFQGHDSILHDIAWSPQGNLFATASRDATVRLWNLSTFSSTILTGHQGQVLKLAFSPDGTELASGSFDGSVRLWNIATGTSREFREHSEVVWDVQFSRDGTLLASASNDGTARVMDLKSGVSTLLGGHQGAVRSVAFSPDGKLVATGGDQTARLWNLATGQSRVLGRHDNLVFGVVFSPDGQIVATCSSDGTIGLWRVSSEEKQTLRGHTGPVTTIVFAPDGKRLASASQDGTARVWDLQNKRNHSLSGHETAVWDVAFSPDSRLIASASADRTVRLWDAADGQLIAVHRHNNVVRRVAFSPDGKWLASASFDQTARVWPVESPMAIPKEPQALRAWFETLTNLRVTAPTDEGSP